MADFKKYQKIPIEKIKLGPRRRVLNEEMRKRVEKIYICFNEVYPCTLEEAIGNFERDANVEREILLWEAMGKVYSEARVDKEFRRVKKKDIYNAVLESTLSNKEDFDRIYSNNKRISLELSQTLRARFLEEYKKLSNRG